MDISKANDIRDAPQVVEEEYIGKGQTNYDRVEAEVAYYTSETIVVVDEETNKQMERLVDKRILAAMVYAYLIQTLDQGTMSFSSIMGIISSI